MTQDTKFLFDPKQSIAYYEGNLSGYPRLMVGKLMLTKNFIAFHQYEVEKVGLLEKARLRQTENVLSIHIDRVVSVSIENGVRSKKSKPNWKNADDFIKKSMGQREFNSKPKLLDSNEKYSRLAITLETDSGVEIAYFELDNPAKWVSLITSRMKKQVASNFP